MYVFKCYLLSFSDGEYFSWGCVLARWRELYLTLFANSSVIQIKSCWIPRVMVMEQACMLRFWKGKAMKAFSPWQKGTLWGIWDTPKVRILVCDNYQTCPVPLKPFQATVCILLSRAHLTSRYIVLQHSMHGWVQDTQDSHAVALHGCQESTQ